MNISSSSRTIRPVLAFLLAVVALAGTAPQSAGEDVLHRVTFTGDDRQERTVEGRIVVEAADGGLLVEGRDGQLWTVTPDRLRQRDDTGDAFSFLSADELGQQLREELGEGFEIVTTRHYVICTNAGTKYGQWCGALFERLMSSFLTHWRARPLRVQEPKRPLAAIVLANEQQFADFAARDAGPEAAGAVGYYSLRTNRMVLYDLTAGLKNRAALSLADISERLAASSFNVATVVHEATHQIAFNCGLHARYADNPVWLTEGMAMYFESPDLNNRSGWRTAGRVNPPRLRQFRDYARRRPDDSLASLVSTDARFGDPEQAAEAYAEAWALTHFLINTRRRFYTDYLHRISEKSALVFDEPEARLETFREVFGDLNRLDRDFLRYVERLGR